MAKDKKIIYLTDYDTVRGKKFEEISSEKFLKLLSKSVETGGKVERYENYPNQFKVEIKDKKYILNLDEELIQNFDKGIYTPFSKELKRLFNQSVDNDKKIKLLSEAEYQMSIGGTIDEEAVPIYIQKQKEDLRLSFTDIKDYFLNFKNDIIKSKEETSDIINNKIWPFCKFDSVDIFGFEIIMALVLMCLITMILIVSPISISLSLLEAFLFVVGAALTPAIATFSIPAFIFVYKHIKNRIERLGSFINHRKFTKQKIKNLTQGNSKVILEDVAKIANDNSLENIDDKEHDSLRITKMILKEFDNIVRKVKCIKDDDVKKDFIKRINAIFNEFNERLEGIENKDSSLDLNLDGYQSLKKDMIVKLETINLELEEFMAKSLRNEQISELTNEFEQKLDNLNNSLNETVKRGK